MSTELDEKIKQEETAQAMRAERAKRTHEDFFSEVWGYPLIETPTDSYTVEEVYNFFKARLAAEK